MNIAIVVIGRNEGERLYRCFESLSSEADVIVYVDSGSTDESVMLAKEMNIEVIELDTASPFSAARARNEGFAYLLKKYPGIQYVQFIDGDCTIATGWLHQAGIFLSENNNYAAVLGHLYERYPEASVYNQLCAMEWKSPDGDLTNFGALGGISMIRANVFQKLRGFNTKVIAGEDSELGVRMALNGYKVTKLDYPMAEHDANMHRFSQWWKRSVRSGHATGQRAFLNGKSVVRDCVKERKSILFWGIGLPAFILLMLIPTNGLSLLLTGGYGVLGMRVYRFRRKQGDSRSDTLLYSFSIVLSKFAEGIGLLKFLFNQSREHYEIIEYK